MFLMYISSNKHLLTSTTKAAFKAMQSAQLGGKEDGEATLRKTQDAEKVKLKRFISTTV